jgi:HEAT repeat protein
VPNLIVALRDRSPDVRRASAQALGKMESAARKAAPALKAACRDEDRSVAEAAGEALKQIQS